MHFDGKNDRVLVLDLDNGVRLELIKIPAGTYIALRQREYDGRESDRRVED